MSKIKILFTSQDQAGVFYWRTQTPGIQIDSFHNDEFEVEINQNVNWEDYDYLKKFHIIHSHKQFGPYEENDKFFDFCKKNGIVTVLDQDDLPDLHPSHPMYRMIKNDKSNLKTYDTIKRCDGITTTTDHFKEHLLKYNRNVIALPNAINVDIMPQFKFKRKDSDKIRMSFVGGSSHLQDLEQLGDLFDLISNNAELADKVTFGLHGFDFRGSMNALSINPDLIKEVASRGLQINQLLKEFDSSDGDIDKIKVLPADLKEKYRHNFVFNTQQKLDTNSNVWIKYEQIFTSKYRLIDNPVYLEHLKKYGNESFNGEENERYRRFYTKPVSSYANHYDFVDVSMVPLVVNNFNLCKSPLKIAEATYKQCAMIVGNNPIYTKYINHGVNGFIAKDSKDWFKITKRLIANPELIKDTAQQLILDTKDEFDLNLVTKKRIEWYKTLVKAKNRV